MRKFCVSLAGLFLVLGTTATARAGDIFYGYELGFCGCKIKELGLSAEQEKKLTAHREKTKKQAQPILKALKAKREEMKRLWQAEKPQRKAILAKQAQMDNVRKKLRSLKVDARLRLLDLLNPEQKKKVREYWAIHQAHKGHGHHPCGHPQDCSCPHCKKANGNHPLPENKTKAPCNCPHQHKGH